MANSKEMTRGAVFPLLFSFTMPLLLGNLLQQTYSLIDAYGGYKQDKPFRLYSSIALIATIASFIVFYIQLQHM